MTTFINAVESAMFWEAAVVVGTVANGAILYAVGKALELLGKIMEY